ncbi:Transcription factor bHLH111 [Dichanthelium oligosanthes]|uniref:Transcription factor bHLH111 n=1 Tax=Dichanthelium oligosanthes TaxID=888268 RepID=A0A1E5UT91_9POAL|nr:Transcription factor bHLH111 [Dichanthelium oligosanthes]
MHLHAAGAVHLQYFMPRHQPQEATDLQAQDSSSAVCRRSSSSTSPAATMWAEYHHRAAHAAALQTASSSASSFPSWSSPYAGTTAALLGAAGSAFATDASSSPDLRLPAAGEHGHGHAWSQHGEQSNSTCYRENFLDLLASKNVTQEMFEDVPGGHYAAQALPGRLGAGSDAAPIKYEVAGSPLFFGSTTPVMHQQGMNMAGCTPCYPYADHHQMKEGSNQQQELETPAMTSFLQQLSSNASVGMHASLDYSGIGLDKICQEGRAMEGSSFGMRSLPDLSSFSGYRSNAESTSSVQPYLRSSNLSDSSKQEQDIVSARCSSSGSGAVSDRKKRPSEEKTSTVKKSKQEGSKASPPKQQVPKVKIGEKITALQQIVSPFGKTDTASVLFETIKYIKFLHEQVQLLSEPYTNSSRNKGNLPWVVEHAETSKQGDHQAEHDLRDRGLCLVPVSWTPEVYRDGTAMDYWTPAYRGCLYR